MAPSSPDKEKIAVNDASDGNGDEDSASVPIPDPSPAPQGPQPTTSPTGSPAAHPHAMFHERHHDQQPEEQDPGIVPAGEDHVAEEDEFELTDLTDGYDTASTGSTSVTSSVYAHTIENGRRYQHFKNGRYPIPNDDEELNREDMKHAMMMELCDGRLFYAPIGENPQKILDIGTGTGESGRLIVLNQCRVV
jgi:hypothetical protein